MNSIFDQGSRTAVFAAVAVGAAVVYIASFIFRRRNSDTPRPDGYTYVGRVGQIWVYPFKSLKGHSVQEADCTAVGMKWKEFTDRHWAVVDDEDSYVTQRKEPTMALVTPTIIGDQIQLTAPGMDPITFPANPPVTESNKSKLTAKSDTLDTVDLGDEVADWLSCYFNRSGLRLHYSAPSLGKRDTFNTKKKWKNNSKKGDLFAFSDRCAFVVLSSASLADLNTHLETPVPIDSFRSNIIVDDCEAYAEDSWSSIKIGEAQLRALDACTRCPVVAVDQDKGIKDENKEPLTTLKEYRLKENYGTKSCFGMNYATDNPGKIKVGDPIYAKFS